MRVAVASGKGGTGKTTVAVNLAVTAARSGRLVHLCDCDVEEPNANLFLGARLEPPTPVSVPIPRVDQDLCRHCGACSEICNFNAIACLARQTVVFPELCHSCGGCWLVCPNQAITQDRRILGEVARGRTVLQSHPDLLFTQGRLRVGETVAPPLIRAVKETASEPLVILDSPPGVTCPVVETLRGVDYALLVTEPTPFGEHDLALAVELVRELDIPCGVVINRASNDDRIGRFCARESLPVLARIPFRRELAAALAEGGLAVDTDPDAALAMSCILDTLEARP